MCYRISVPKKDQVQTAYKWVKQIPLEFTDAIHHVNAFDNLATPVITSEKPTDIQLYEWGLIPYWCKDEKQASQVRSQTHNAKAETVFEKPSFKSTIGKNRCLVIVDGFYEWQHHKGKKFPYFVYLKNQEPFSLGGIYDTWVNRQTGEVINSYSVITTDANPLLAKIHNSKLRMPYIVPKNEERLWIDETLSPVQVKEMMRPFDDSLMDAHTISKLITSRNEEPNVPQVKEPFSYPELQENTNTLFPLD